MIMKLVREHLPEWIEAGSILMGVFVAAIFSAGITYYKVDVMTEDVAYIKKKLEVLPVLVERVNQMEVDDERMQGDINYLIRGKFNGKTWREEGFSLGEKQATTSLQL